MHDPTCIWPRGSAYALLAPAAVTPDATTRELLDASFELMERGLMTHETRQAWDELRQVPRRLAVDFLLLLIDVPAEIDRARQALDAWAGARPEPPGEGPER
jgi:hypothetical protein